MTIKQWKAIHRSLGYIQGKLEGEPNDLLKLHIKLALSDVDSEIATLERKRRRGGLE